MHPNIVYVIITKKFHKIETINKSNDISKESNVISKDENKEICKENNKYDCRYCNKIYKHKQTRWTHEKICKINNNKINNNKNDNELLKQEINELKNKINILLQSNKISPKTIKKINTQNNINNINNNTQNNINNINN